MINNKFNKELNIGDSIYKIKVIIFFNYISFEVIDSNVEIKEYILSNKYEDKFGPHEVFELLSNNTEKETIITGWKDNHSATYLPYNSTEPDFICDNFYGDKDYIELKYIMFNTDKESIKNKICEEVQKLIKNIKKTTNMLEQITDNIYSL